MSKSLVRVIALAGISILFYTGSSNATAWTHYNTENSSLPYDKVLTIAQDHIGSIWCGTMQGEVCRLVGNDWISFSVSSSVYSMVIDAENIKWIGARLSAEGIGYGTLIRMAHYETEYFKQDNSGYPGGNAFSVAIDNNGHKWIGTGGKAVVRYDSQNDLWNYWKVPGGWEVKSIAVDGSDNSIWVGTEGYGAARFTVEDDFEFFNSSYTPKGFVSNYITCVFIDSSGDKWFGSYGGVSRLRSNGDWSIYDISSGLPANRINTVTEDHNGNIWVGTNSGAARYNGVSWEVYNTSNSDIPCNTIFSIFVDLEGAIWFGTDNGISRFLQQEINIPEGRVAIQGGHRGYINPAIGDNAKIIFNPDNSGTVRVKIFTANAHKVWETSRESNGEQGYVIWDCKNFQGRTVSSGVYAVHIEGPGINKFKRIPIVR